MKGGISSSSSVAQPPPAAAPVDSDDSAWSHCTLPDTNKKHSLMCNYCGKVCTSRITRIKLHLACIKKSGVAPYPKVPSDVKDQMLALLLKKDEANQKKANELEKIRGEVDLDHSEGESLSEDDGNEVIVLKSRKGTSSSTCGPIEKFCKPSIEVAVKKNSLSQKDGPTAYEMGGPFLQKRKRKLMESFKNHHDAWSSTGCTVMTDAWTDKRSRGVMNLVVHSATRALFLDSVDCSSIKKDGKYIFELVDKCIDDIGADKVVQVVTDNASVNVAAASLMKAKRPSIFWNGCAAHCIDLMLEDIGKLKPVDKTIAQARQVTVFLYAHTRVLALMRDVLGNDLVRSGMTRFSTAYLNLKSLQDNKKELQKLFRSEELDEMGYLKKAKGKKAMKTVQSDPFWKRVDTAVNFFEPMANLLRRMDSDVPAMGFFHGCMLDAKKGNFCEV
ncbi:hypothetical protein ACQ4PT_016912 [Festuca glaucescens]